MNLNTADEQLCRRDASDGPRAVGRRRKQQPPPSLAAAIGFLCPTKARNPVNMTPMAPLKAVVNGHVGRVTKAAT
jgi:hypothetical protein